MLRTSLWPALLTVALLSTGCPPPPAPPPPPPPTPAPETTPVVLENRELPVKCGCKIESEKKCGEWAEVDGQWVKMTGEHGLGSMPFCGKDGLRANVSGKLTNQTLHVTAITVLPAPDAPRPPG